MEGKPDFQAGHLLLIDKPLNWTSFDVVNKLRYALKKKLDVKKIKVGHAGTLDPLATGLLLICTGKKTKEIESLMGMAKTYTGTITLGATTPSYDLETELENISAVSLTETDIKATCIKFVGHIEQIPPVFSAKKVDGKKAYISARKGQEIEMKKSQIHISEFRITKIKDSNILKGGIDCDFEVTCSKGTYIRSLANDFGASLGTGGFLSALRRTCIGDFKVTDSLSVDDALEFIHA